MASLIHDTSPILRHSWQKNNKGLYYGFKDAIPFLIYHSIVSYHCFTAFSSVIIVNEFGSRVMHEIIIPYDIIHVQCMYAQELMSTEAQKGHPLQSTISTISILFFHSLDFHSIFPFSRLPFYFSIHSGTSILLTRA